MQKFQVTGMSCAACQARVEKAVGKVPGVTSVAVSLLTNSMGVEGTASPESVIEAVQQAGYGASLISSSSSRKALSSSSIDGVSDGSSPKALSAGSSEDLLKDRETPKLVRRLILSAGFLLILMYISMGHNMWDFPLPSYFDNNYLGLALLQMLLALIVMCINRKFFDSGTKSLLHGAPNMDTLVALGSGVSFLWSLFVVFEMCGKLANGAAMMDVHELYHHQLYFESAAMIPALITVGKTLESISKGRTTNALKSLMKLAPKTARILRPAGVSDCSAVCDSSVTSGSDLIEEIVPIEDVRVDDIFAVKPGESIPVDGVVIEGESAVDESALTGESIPVDKASGAKVSAATINRSGYLRCRATRVGEDTTLSQIIQMVSDAAATKAPIARIADKVSGIFVPAVIAIAALVTVAWLIAGHEASFALARGISVLVISCPCALGLATPVAIMVGNGLGARNGVLFKTSEALETTGKAAVIALDKTGTITSGTPRVTSIQPAPGVTSEALLAKAYALEKLSEHPLAKAIVDEYESSSGSATADSDGKLSDSKSSISPSKTTVPVVSDFSIHSGHGLEGMLDGKKILGGSDKYIRTFAELSPEMQQAETKCSEQGETPIFFEEEGRILGMIAIADTIKTDSEEGIRQLRNLGLKVVMLTGDNRRTAEAIASKAGVDDVVADVLPEGKAQAIKDLQKQGKVIMVGDGINDAPALTTADIGIAIGAGTDVAIESADIVLMNSNLPDVAAAVRLSRKTLKNIHENLFWAFFYNVICIPIAAGILSWKMNPMIGAAAMSISSFTVCMNALRLNLFNMKDPSHDKPLKTIRTGENDLLEEISQNRQPAEIKHESSQPTEIMAASSSDAPENTTIPETEKRSLPMKKTLKIEGMMCEHCEASVRKALEALPFIASAIPNHTTNSCVVEISDEAAWDEEQVKAIIEGKDYTYLGEE
ncbi:MAG: heavy metal translocating P-type ATPase [Clostridiales bacterium]|nr:heavy metal translocating P-type ATPase [Clostridiales bacterium]